MTLGKLGLQTMLRSEKAFDRITFKEAVPVPKSVYYEKFMNWDNTARAEYRKLKILRKSRRILMTEIIKNPQLLFDFAEKLRAEKRILIKQWIIRDSQFEDES